MKVCVRTSINALICGKTSAGVEATWGDHDGRTPLHFAAGEGNIAAVGVPYKGAILSCFWYIGSAQGSLHRATV
eukprot:scaffold249592_cov22-Tisochrysis_lutea.AAC.2